MVRAKWLAALSNGRMAIEGVEPFDEIAGRLSPWQRLLRYLESQSLYITGMRIQVFKDGDATRTYNLPSFNVLPTGQHPKWNHVLPVRPLGYGYRRVMRHSLTTGDERRYIEVYAGYDGGLLLSLFVDEIEGTESWTILHRPKKMPVLA